MCERCTHENLTALSTALRASGHDVVASLGLMVRDSEAMVLPPSEDPGRYALRIQFGLRVAKLVAQLDDEPDALIALMSMIQSGQSALNATMFALELAIVLRAIEGEADAPLVGVARMIPEERVRELLGEDEEAEATLEQFRAMLAAAPVPPGVS